MIPKLPPDSIQEPTSNNPSPAQGLKSIYKYKSKYSFNDEYLKKLQTFNSQPWYKRIFRKLP